MNINEPAQQTGVVSANAFAGPAANPSASLGQQDFLELLVAQMENQDPTKPMDNFQFLSQIAQFGMVDGIQGLQSSFGTVADSFKQSQLLQASSLLDRDVLAESNVGTFTATENIRGIVNVTDPTSQVTVEIRSSAGVLVDSFQLGGSTGGEMAYEWDGLGQNGEALPYGQYFVHAKGLSNGEPTNLSVDTLNRVESITIDEQALVSLTLTSGETVDLAAVKEIR